MSTVDDTVEAWGPERFLNRELSWLDFNSRVLAQAEDPDVPLLERLKFCAIYASNLDEFFQVRVAGLKEQVAAGISKSPPDGLSPIAQLAAIRTEVLAQAERLEHVHLDVLRPALAVEGIHLLDRHDLDEQEEKVAAGEFENRIFPILTPLAVDLSHPFPYISNLSLSLAVLIDDPEVESLRFARLKVPPSLPRMIEVAPSRFVPTEQVIAGHIDQLFPGVDVIGAWPFRVTRNADMTLDDEDAEDLVEAIEVELRRRRFGRAIRLEIDAAMPGAARELLTRELDIDDDDVYPHDGPLDLTGLWQLLDIDRADLKAPGFTGVTPRRLRDVEDSRDFFNRIARSEILLHHPYDSFGASVTEFIRQASRDPGVLAIKLTLYRTSGDSPIIDALIRAAERGKQVAALVELKARFDEEANISWARRLEDAGVHVVYGLAGLKIHTKTALVVRDEPDGVRRYCHVGTGNYNPRTARLYEDFGVLTADAEVGADLSQLFNFLTGYGRQVNYQRLLVAPQSLRTSLEQFIDGEIAAAAVKKKKRRKKSKGSESDQGGGAPSGGHIILKMNSLVDADLIDRLYAASAAGVRVDLLIRGICCLRPGVAGLSENIRVRSIVGRYLEHSRVYYFANGGGDETPRYFIGSADLMPRNLDRRVEVMIRVDDSLSQARLREALDVNLADTALAWELGPDNQYERVGGTVDSHNSLELLASARVARADAGVAEPAGPRDDLIRAAGCLVYRHGDNGLEVLVAHRPHYDDWSLPKGKRDPGESDLECALREVAEETGFRGEVGPELSSAHYEVRGRPKVVRYWLLLATEGEFVANEEVDEVRWVSPADAAALLGYEHDRSLLTELPTTGS